MGTGCATWQEFGYQIREGPTLSATTAVRNGEIQVDLSWTRVNTGHWNPAPPVTYSLRGDDLPVRYQLRHVTQGLDLLRYTDTVTPSYRHSDSNRYAYQVSAVVSDAARRPIVFRATWICRIPRGRRSPGSGSIRVIGAPGGRTSVHGWLCDRSLHCSFNENVHSEGGSRSLIVELGWRGTNGNLHEQQPFNHSLFLTTRWCQGDMDTDGMSIPAGRIDLNGGTIEDEAGNPAMLDYPGVEPQPQPQGGRRQADAAGCGSQPEPC